MVKLPATIVKVLLLVKGVPPVGVVNHSKVPPAQPLAVKVIFPVPQRALPPLATVGELGTSLTFAVATTRLGLTQVLSVTHSA